MEVRRVKLSWGIEIIVKKVEGPQVTKYAIIGDCDVVIYFTSLEGYNDSSAITRFRNIKREFLGLRLYKKIGSEIFSFSDRTGRFRRIPKKGKYFTKKEVTLV
ncbi:hypothetical protein EOL72_01565 [Candidatus Falkowbacteria bacterium]|jgi:hypothetical protein|nr:hypothetical protein [Candidatus Falkowbacteria bacterium]